MKHKKGNWVWLHTDGSVYSRDKKGNVECVLNISLDITRRKEAEDLLKEVTIELENKVNERTEELQSSESRYKSFVAHSTEGIWRFELEKPVSIRLTIGEQIKRYFKYAYLAECNDAMAKMYGYSSAREIVGMRLKDFLLESDRENIEYLEAFINSGYRLSNAESHEKDKDGNDRYFENSFVGEIEDGYLKRAWGVQKDITDRKEIEQRKDDFISITGHELRTPITSIKLYCEILSKEYEFSKPKRVSNLIPKLKYQIDRLSRLTNDLVDSTKIQEGKLMLEKEQFDIVDLIKDIVQDFKIVNPERNIVVRGEKRKLVWADPFRINQVLVNLIGNALKYSPNLKKVVITIESDKKFIYIHIQDFGIGIPKADQKKIFDRFFQSSSRINGGGLGLGLYISSNIIKAHGGELLLISQKGKGSRFTVKLLKS